MNKSIFRAVIMLAIVIISSCNSNEKKSDLEKIGLVGKVKSISSVCYNVYDKFGEGNIQKAKPENALVQIVMFDSLGNILADKCISINDVLRKYTVVYNDKHLKIKWLCYEDYDDAIVQFGSNLYYDEKDNLVKEVNLKDNSVENYHNTYDNKGRLVSQIGTHSKKYWNYNNDELIKYTEYFFDMKMEHFYKDGLVYKDVRSPNVYWIYTYDEQRRLVESTMFKNDIINRKCKKIYLGKNDKNPIEVVEWNSDGEISHDYSFIYFTSGNDTLSILKFDKDELNEIVFIFKDTQSITEETYEVKSNLFFNLQYIYENGNLISLKDMKNGKDYKYVDGIATITEISGDFIHEIKYKRNVQICKKTKDKSGKIISSYMVDGDDSKKTITLILNGETSKCEEIYENGKLVKSIDKVSGLTNTLIYNKEGYVAEVKSSDGTILHYKYEFDAQGNWVKMIGYKNGKPNTIMERSIIYY